MNQQIRFCKGFDGTRLAYAMTGEGPPLVRAPHWLTHLEYEWQSPIWKSWIESLSRAHTLLRMDERGCGLSDRDVADISFEAWVRDLEAVVDAAGLERFALFGHSQGGAIAVEYAIRHPGRVTHLVLLGAYARGSMKRDVTPQRIDELQALLKLVEVGWGRDDPSYRQIFSTGFVPAGTLEQINSMSDLQRKSATPDCAVRILRSMFSIDVREPASRVKCPTLVLHARGDRRVPFEEGRLFASLVPGARFVPLETDNHILLPQEPAFRQFFDELEAFEAGGIHHRFQVAHPGFEGDVRHVAIGEPAAALVHAQQPVIARERLDPRLPDRALPLVLEMGQPVRRPDERRTVT
ncbi:MAG TPA: alpha/beta hydrolase, partial [Usitatibacteraceae bacterium]|nr:alpha/beta hydrolase [Usitatibacteraceae bacterium]